MKTPKMNHMSKKNKNQNNELIEKLNDIQSQLNEVKSDAGIVVEEPDFVFTREQLEEFLTAYTSRISRTVFEEMFSNLDAEDVVSFDVDGREINPYIDEDSLGDKFVDASDSVESSVMMDVAEEVMSDIGVI
jgi:hypothetical protein